MAEAERGLSLPVRIAIGTTRSRTGGDLRYFRSAIGVETSLFAQMSAGVVANPPMQVTQWETYPTVAVSNGTLWVGRGGVDRLQALTK